MGIAFVAAIAFILAVFTADDTRRPYALAAAFILRITIPSYVGDLGIRGLLPSLHVSTIVILAYATVWPIITRKTNLDRLSGASRIPVLCHIAIVAVVVWALALSGSISAAGSALGLLLNQVIAPYVFCVLVASVSLSHEGLERKAGQFFVICCVVQSVLSIAVYLGSIAQPYLSTYSSLASYAALRERQLGTLDHPLALGLLLAAGVPMAGYIGSRPLRYLCVLILISGIGLTQSRIALVGALVGIIYFLIIVCNSARERMILLGMSFVGYTLVNATGVFQGTFDRIQNDQGSSRDRSLALNLFLDDWRDFKVFGVGVDQSKAYFLSHGLRSSGESAAISYSVGIGIPMTVLYFAVIAYLIVEAVRLSGRISPAAASAIVVVFSIQFYSSISVESAAGMILWTTIGIGLAARDRGKPGLASTNANRYAYSG